MIAVAWGDDGQQLWWSVRSIKILRALKWWRTAHGRGREKEKDREKPEFMMMMIHPPWWAQDGHFKALPRPLCVGQFFEPFFVPQKGVKNLGMMAEGWRLDAALLCVSERVSEWEKNVQFQVIQGHQNRSKSIVWAIQQQHIWTKQTWCNQFIRPVQSWLEMTHNPIRLKGHALFAAFSFPKPPQHPSLPNI